MAAGEARRVLGDNIELTRRARGLTVRELADRVKELGLPLSASGISDVENAARKVSVDELLIFAIALNTSVIDLLTPADGSALTVAAGVDPLPPSWLEKWLSGMTPWPPDQANKDYTDQFFGAASEARQLRQRTDARPEMAEISALRSAVAGAIEGPGTWVNQIDDPNLMAQLIRDTLGRVNAYVNLLADKIEKNGYGG